MTSKRRFRTERENKKAVVCHPLINKAISSLLVSWGVFSGFGRADAVGTTGSASPGNEFFRRQKSETCLAWQILAALPASLWEYGNCRSALPARKPNSHRCRIWRSLRMTGILKPLTSRPPRVHQSRAYPAVQPPSITSVCPVMYEAAGEHRKATPMPISRIVPARFIGMASNCFSFNPSARLAMGEWI